jgi:hypothetical protein
LIIARGKGLFYLLAAKISFFKSEEIGTWEDEEQKKNVSAYEGRNVFLEKVFKVFCRIVFPAP